MRLLVLCALAAFLAPSQAQILWHTNNGPELVLSSARQVELRHRARADEIAGLMRSINAVPGGTGAVAVVDRIKGPGPLGPLVDVDVKRALPWANIGKAVAKSLPLISTAVAIAEIAEAIRCREAPGSGAECDMGTDEVTQVNNVYCLTYSGSTHCTSSSITTAQNYVDVLNASLPGSQFPYTRIGPSAANVTAFTLVTNWKPSGQSYSNLNTVLSTASTTQCPAIVVGGATIVPVKGPDNKCPTLTYIPATEDVVADRVDDYGDKTKAPQIVDELIDAGKPIEHPWPESDPVPGSINGPRETTTHPDGSTTTRDTRYDLSPTPTGYGWSPTVTTKEWAPGVTPTPPGEVTDGTTTSGGSAPETEIITCGLPNTPPCKIDEGGTPPPEDPFEPNPSSWFDPIRGVFDNPPVADTSWTWSFSLPTGCTAMEVGPFMGHTVNVDPCQWQPMIHDILSVIWLCTGVWICIGMVGRTISGS